MEGDLGDDLTIDIHGKEPITAERVPMGPPAPRLPRGVSRSLLEQREADMREARNVGMREATTSDTTVIVMHVSASPSGDGGAAVLFDIDVSQSSTHVSAAVRSSHHLLTHLDLVLMQSDYYIPVKTCNRE